MAQTGMWILIIVVVIIVLFYLDTHTCQCTVKPESFAIGSGDVGPIKSIDGYYIMDPNISLKAANKDMQTFMHETTMAGMVTPELLRGDIDNNNIYTIPMDSRASPEYPGLDDYATVLDANDSRVPYGGVDPSIKNDWIFNDLYSPTGDRAYYSTVRPFNNYEQKLSYMQAVNPYLIRNMFDNPYVDLAVEEARLQPTCMKFNNINQCIAKCTNEEECIGFYLQQDAMGNDTNQCCFLNQPIPNNLAQRTVYYFDSYDPAGNPTYSGRMNLNNCLAQCSECNLNNCPQGNRCANLRYDVRKSNCLITNNDHLRDVALEGDGTVINNEGFDNLPPNYPQSALDIYNAGPVEPNGDILITRQDAGSANQFINDIYANNQVANIASSPPPQSVGLRLYEKFGSTDQAAVKNNVRNTVRNTTERLGATNDIVPPTIVGSNMPGQIKQCLSAINENNADNSCLNKLADWKKLMPVNQGNFAGKDLVVDVDAPTNPDLNGTGSIFRDYIAYNNSGLI